MARPTTVPIITPTMIAVRHKRPVSTLNCLYAACTTSYFLRNRLASICASATLTIRLSFSSLFIGYT